MYVVTPPKFILGSQVKVSPQQGGHLCIRVLRITHGMPKCLDSVTNPHQMKQVVSSASCGWKNPSHCPGPTLLPTMRQQLYLGHASSQTYQWDLPDEP